MIPVLVACPKACTVVRPPDRTAFVSLSGELVRDSRQIAAHYCRTWMALDVASSIPWAELLQVSSGRGKRVGGGSSLGTFSDRALQRPGTLGFLGTPCNLPSPLVLLSAGRTAGRSPAAQLACGGAGGAGPAAAAVAASQVGLMRLAGLSMVAGWCMAHAANAWACQSAQCRALG
jgi:hypothetical protein